MTVENHRRIRREEDEFWQFNRQLGVIYLFRAYVVFDLFNKLNTVLFGHLKVEQTQAYWLNY